MTIPDNNKPFPIRLGELKPKFQRQAAFQGRSLHNWLKHLLKEMHDKTDEKGNKLRVVKRAA